MASGNSQESAGVNIRDGEFEGSSKLSLVLCGGSIVVAGLDFRSEAAGDGPEDNDLGDLPTMNQPKHRDSRLVT